MSKNAKELAFNPEPKPEHPGAMWDAYNKSWEDQIIGKGIKVYEQHCFAKLRACMVGDPFAMYVPDPSRRRSTTTRAGTSGTAASNAMISRFGTRALPHSERRTPWKTQLR